MARPGQESDVLLDACDGCEALLDPYLPVLEVQWVAEDNGPFLFCDLDCLNDALKRGVVPGPEWGSSVYLFNPNPRELHG